MNATATKTATKVAPSAGQIWRHECMGFQVEVLYVGQGEIMDVTGKWITTEVIGFTDVELGGSGRCMLSTFLTSYRKSRRMARKA